MKADPTFKERFGISTPIIYSHDVIVDPQCKDKFAKAWKRFLSKNEPNGSRLRRNRFDALLRKIEKLGDDLPYTQRVEIRKISKDVGYGVFANQYIPPYSTLNHYAGILRPDKDVSEDNDSTFMFSAFPNYSIDAVKVGNWCRFMNHSSEKAANVIAWEHYSEWGPRIIFTAGSKGIKKGAQLLYSYGESYWEEDAFLNLF